MDPLRPEREFSFWGSFGSFTEAAPVIQASRSWTANWPLSGYSWLSHSDPGAVCSAGQPKLLNTGKFLWQKEVPVESWKKPLPFSRKRNISWVGNRTMGDQERARRTQTYIPQSIQCNSYKLNSAWEITKQGGRPHLPQTFDPRHANHLRMACSLFPIKTHRNTFPLENIDTSELFSPLSLATENPVVPHIDPNLKGSSPRFEPSWAHYGEWFFSKHEQIRCQCHSCPLWKPSPVAGESGWTCLRCLVPSRNDYVTPALLFQCGFAMFCQHLWCLMFSTLRPVGGNSERSCLGWEQEIKASEI